MEATIKNEITITAAGMKEVPNQIKALEREIEENKKQILGLKQIFITSFLPGETVYTKDGDPVTVNGYDIRNAKLVVEYNSGKVAFIDPMEVTKGNKKGEII